MALIGYFYAVGPEVLLATDKFAFRGACCKTRVQCAIMPVMGTVTAEKIIADIEMLPATEVGRVADYCQKLMNGKGARRDEAACEGGSPVSKLINVLKRAKLPETAGDDVRLEYLLKKHASR